jgi:putative hydrolase of the HAD superfamily
MSAKGSVRAVTFDCWGTLITDLDFSKSSRARIRALVETSGGRLDSEQARELFDRAWREHHRRWVDGVQYGSPGIARFCASELADDLLSERLQEAFEEAGRHGDLVALPGAADTLRTLREAGVRTALVCDTGLTPGRIVRDFLEEVGLLAHLEFCAFSNEVGEPKPSATIFRAALDAIESAPQDAVHVGDLLRTDVHGARELGMRTVRITAVNDDSASGFSWDPNASFGPASQAPAPVTPDIDDADEIVSSHAELINALRRLGALL